MSLKFRSLVLILATLPAVAVSCRSFTWKDRGGDMDAEASARGIKSVDQLEDEYDSRRYWDFWRLNWDQRVLAVRRDLHDLHRGFDRHFFNYDWNDPYLSR
jgi:hypothetical protein